MDEVTCKYCSSAGVVKYGTYKDNCRCIEASNCSKKNCPHQRIHNQFGGRCNIRKFCPVVDKSITCGVGNGKSHLLEALANSLGLKKIMTCPKLIRSMEC